ncbi:hypothetical protein GYH30_037916 [Glycine max]|nr:hypothetical protein GYH30_037916 [Glycine max]
MDGLDWQGAVKDITGLKRMVQRRLVTWCNWILYGRCSLYCWFCLGSRGWRCYSIQCSSCFSTCRPCPSQGSCSGSLWRAGQLCWLFICYSMRNSLQLYLNFTHISISKTCKIIYKLELFTFLIVSLSKNKTFLPITFYSLLCLSSSHHQPLIPSMPRHPK